MMIIKGNRGMKFFECCNNCKYSWSREGLVYCVVHESYLRIEFPRLMGGSSRCECYERWHKPKREKFQYPKKEIK